MSAKNFTLDEALARIEALEKYRVKSAYTETILWSGNNWSNGFKLTLSQPYTNFDQIIIYGNPDNMGYSTQILPVSTMVVGGKYGHANPSLGNFTINSTTQFTFGDQGDIGVYKIIGVKFTNNLYYKLLDFSVMGVAA